MSRVLRLLTIYILLDFCKNALGDMEPDISVEVDGLEGGDREDDDKEDQMKLMGLDYYNGRSTNSREDYFDYTSQEPQQLKNKREDNIVVLDSMDTRNYKAEMEAGNKADILGTNPHYYQPSLYPDFSRRFVLQYPYTEVKNKKRHEVNIDKLVPILASPELVLAVAEKSALIDAKTPKDHNVEVVRKDILRTGDYWNAVWKEDVDPKVLRTKHENKLETVRAEIPPGSTLYDLVSKLKHLSPTLLYVVNDKAS